MSTLTPIAPDELRQRLAAGAVTLIDIREPDEYAREHIEQAVSVPLSRLEQGRLTLETHGDVVFHCRSGMRTNANCARLSAHIDGPAFMLEGGLEAWRKSGMPVRTNAAAPLELSRQVQLTIGLLLLITAALTAFVHPYFIILPALFGAGLTFAGASGWCGMAQLLVYAPWNRTRSDRPA